MNKTTQTKVEIRMADGSWKPAVLVSEQPTCGVSGSGTALFQFEDGTTIRRRWHFAKIRRVA